MPAAVATLEAAVFLLVVEAAPIMDAHQRGNILVDVFAVLLVAVEKVLAVEQRVSTKAEVATQFLDNFVDVVVEGDVQASRLPYNCPLGVKSGVEKTLASRRRPHVVHDPRQCDVVHPTRPPVGEGRQVRVLRRLERGNV